MTAEWWFMKNLFIVAFFNLSNFRAALTCSLSVCVCVLALCNDSDKFRKCPMCTDFGTGSCAQKIRSNRRNEQTNKRTNKREEKKAFNEFVNFKIIAVASSPMFHISNILRLAKMLLRIVRSVSEFLCMDFRWSKLTSFWNSKITHELTAQQKIAVWLMKLGWLQPHFIRAISTEPNANADKKNDLINRYDLFFWCVVLWRFLSETKKKKNTILCLTYD